MDDHDRWTSELNRLIKERDDLQKSARTSLTLGIIGVAASGSVIIYYVFLALSRVAG